MSEEDGDTRMGESSAVPVIFGHQQDNWFSSPTWDFGDSVNEFSHNSGRRFTHHVRNKIISQNLPSSSRGNN
jgi:hypothetical protein